MHLSKTKAVTKQTQETNHDKEVEDDEEEDDEEDDEEVEPVVYANPVDNQLETQLKIPAANNDESVQYNNDPNNVPDTIQQGTASNIFTSTEKLQPPRTRKRVRSDKPAPEVANKRAHNDGTSFERALVAQDAPALSLSDRCRETTSMTNSAQIYRQHLTKHTETVRAEHAKKYNELVQLNAYLREYVQTHQQLLRTHNDAQEHVNTVQGELDEICKKSVLLITGQSALDASGGVLEQTCTETFKALALEHRAQTLANVTARKETEAKLIVAQVALKEAEEVVSPSLLHIEYEQSRINSLKETTEELTMYMMHAEFLRTLVEAGPSAIATLESVLQTNITLKDVADMVQKDKRSAEANNHPVIDPTD